MLKKDIHFVAKASIEQLFKTYHTSLVGLDEQQINKSRNLYGNNKIERANKPSLLKQLKEAFINPFSIVLLILAIVSTITDIIFPLYGLFNHTIDDLNYIGVVIIISMVTISGLLRFIQESRSGKAAENLLNMITTTCSVNRQGLKEIPIDEVVVGDIIQLSAGDMIPADVRILNATDLFIMQSNLTGESEPVEKVGKTMTDTQNITDYANIAFMSSNVVSGSATALVIAVGSDTQFGMIAKNIEEVETETSFSKGINSVSWILIRFMLIMVPIVFFINGFTKGDFIKAFLFAISIAVGLTPEMLPMIVTTCLAKGAISMSHKQTIVKNINSIQNFGAMDILCTDKTGTLTQDEVVLEYHLNIDGQEDHRVLRHAYLNSYFQTGYKNLMDQAIIKKTEEQEQNDPRLIDLSENYTKIDEIPFDFNRRRLSVLVKDREGKTQMVTKGAIEEMLNICSYVETSQGVEVLSSYHKQNILTTVNHLNEQGFRVLGIAQKSNLDYIDLSCEAQMVLIGYLAFLDPPKSSTKKAIQALKEYGVTTKILTGDNEKVTRTICKQVGLKVNRILLGHEIETMSDLELETIVEDIQVFAKLSPSQKVKVVTALQNKGHVVGFMGDGINDANALKVADIGISVDTAVDIAKESADIVLLEKDLMVLEQGIIEGRKTYANMIKYIKMTASSNFGNIFSILGASALLPFLPMDSLHLIILNLIYDLCCIAIPWDHVDEEYLKIPRKWEANSVASFMLWLGPTSSIFDFLTFFTMYFIICPIVISNGVLFNDLPTHFSGTSLKTMQLGYIALFQTGWFVQSMWSQTLVIHMIRTPKIPFIQSRASGVVTLTSIIGISFLTLIPFTPLGKMLNLVALPSIYFAFLIPCILLYMILATIVKKVYIKHHHELL